MLALSLLVTAVLSLGLPPAAAIAAAPGSPNDFPVTVYLAVGENPPSSLTREQLEAQARTQFETMSKYWRDQSAGQVDFRIENLAWAPAPVPCGETGAPRNAREAAARADVGYTAAPQRRFFYAVIAGCPFVGNGSSGSSVTGAGTSVYIEQNQAENGLWAHEFGHTLSFGHASTLYCPDNAVDCDSVREGGPGQSPTYADTTDTMSSSYANIIKGWSTPNAIRVGFIGPDEYRNIAGSTDQTVTIRSRDILTSTTEPALRSIRVNDPVSNRTYYVELTSRDGYNAPIWWGGRPEDISPHHDDQWQFDFGVRVMRFQAPEGANYQDTFLLPAPRNDAGVRRLVWDQGTTFTSASGGTTIEVTAVTRTTATLHIVTRTDVIAPAAPTALASDGSAATGTAEPGSTVTVVGPDGSTLGTAVADATSGAFSVPLDPAQAEGVSLQVTATDAAGNRSTAAPVVVIVPSAVRPAPPTALSSDGTQVSGTATPGATVTVVDGAGAVLGSATADAATGAFTVALSAGQADGTALQVFVTDAAGRDSDLADVTAIVESRVTPAPLPPAPVAVVGGGGTAPRSGAIVSKSELAATGSDAGMLPLVGSASLLLGAAMILMLRRQRSMR